MRKPFLVLALCALGALYACISSIEINPVAGTLVALVVLALYAFYDVFISDRRRH